MRFLGSTKTKTTREKYGENMPYLEIPKIVLIHCNSYQQNSRIMFTFVSNKSFGQLVITSPEIFIFLKTFDSEFLYIEVWFTDENSTPLEIKDKKNITLVIN